MAIQIDLEKAYDKLEWSFIKDMLIRANLPADLIDIIMSCISTISTSILFNGEALDPIYPSRGIRQGDPLSPYLFILCMEFLGQLIEEKCNSKLWQPMKASCDGPAFSHLFFADDLVLFAKADHINCSAVRDVIDEFCSASGQAISDAKSKVYFSPNVDRDSRESFCDILGFASTPSLGKYLGIPIKHPGASAQDFNFILDRVKNKLAGWKANLLYLAGRAVLIQVSSAAIPAYVMQCTYIPNKILEGVDRVNRNFLWGLSESAKKIHWVGWQKIWKAAKKGRDTFNEGSMWTIGKDSKLSFLWDNWTGIGPLRCIIQGLLTQGADQWKVCDIISDLRWDWGRIPFDIPLTIKSIIQATPIPFMSRGQDRLAWSGNPRGIFDLKSAYFLATVDEIVPPFSSGWIWKLEMLPKIRNFLWLCQHNSIGVKSCLARRGVVADKLCPICQREPESIIHALRDCAWVREVWMQLGVNIANQEFWRSNIQDWINFNGKISHSRAQEKPPWKTAFSFAMWCIWKSQNMAVFNGKPLNQNLPNEIMNQVLKFIHLDAQAVVAVLRNNDYVNNIISPILDDCKHLATRFQRIQFNHCYRQANHCADLLARMGALQDLEFISFASPPVDICNAFEDDLNGVYFNKMCYDPVVFG
ncbi:uncharacterized protein LOC136068763 [Quercus suber]|uniref:uncharacterized protein LOC136068763 n=1 Tax=Quercus suber TaxID=58331 RepID=UPI0032DE52A4